MNNCVDVDAIMTAYVDGEITAGEAQAVQAHLDGCPACRDRAVAEQAVRERLRAAAPALGERAPAALWARCAAAAHGPVAAAPFAARRTVSWASLSMAATILLAAGALFIAGQRQSPALRALAAQFAIDHDKCFLVEPVEAPEFGHQEARVQLAGIIGTDVALPFESPDFDVLEVRKCAYDQGGVGHVLCAWRGAPVSLFVVPNRSLREQLLEIINHDALVWSAGDHGFVLVAEHGPVDMGQVARHVRQTVH